MHARVVTGVRTSVRTRMATLVSRTKASVANRPGGYVFSRSEHPESFGRFLRIQLFSGFYGNSEDPLFFIGHFHGHLFVPVDLLDIQLKNSQPERVGDTEFFCHLGEFFQDLLVSLNHLS